MIFNSKCLRYCILRTSFFIKKKNLINSISRENVKFFHFSNIYKNLKIEEDYFYINPLRKLTCIGCGEFLQTTNERKSGFVPYKVYEKYSNGRLKFYTKVKGEEVDSIPDGVKVDVNNYSNFRIKTKIILCKRCYRLQHYKSADVKCEVDINRIENIIKCRKQLQEDIKKKAGITKEKHPENINKNYNMKSPNEEIKDDNKNYCININKIDNKTDFSEKLEMKNNISNENNSSKLTEKKECKFNNLTDENKDKMNFSNLAFINRKMNRYFKNISKNDKNKQEYICSKEKTRNFQKIEDCNTKNVSNTQLQMADVIQKNKEAENLNSNDKSQDIIPKKLDEEGCKKEENYYQDNSYNIDKRSINIFEKKDILKKRNDIKKLDVEKMEASKAKYIEGDRNHIMNNLIKKMKKKSLVLYLIDITNIENTILPELYIGCKNKDVNIIWLVNKVDCLPKSTNLEIVKMWFRNLVRQIKNSHINDLIFISALKFYNYNILEERMKYYVDLDKGIDIYIVGCVNVGKSTFINSFLKYINYKHIGDIYNKRKKGGVTTSSIPYTTLNYNVFKIKKNINIIDTIGIPTKYQYSSILYKDIDLNSISINKKIQPFTYRLKEDSSIILGSLCYINLIYGNFCLLTFYMSNKVTIHICKSEKVQSFLEKKKCSFLYPPHIKDDFDLLKPFVKHTIKIYGKDFESVDDIVISDLGWFSLTGQGIKIIEIFAPKNIKIYRRPSMITDAIKHTQIDVFKYKSYRGRTSKILKKKKKLIEELDRLSPNRRVEMKSLTLQKEKSQLENLNNFNETSIICDKKDIENIVHYL
ncbi:GTP-binding protein, putative [Plasmodium gallinaceum]|uniref:GTP-binding protein, putative n=1 Tax=Plasmodium gallinaceum TaxID=5849 RepID=A0A1J1GQQ2_PLAGA|nr:GTP-binding protein, putative [Plasmodium gallinaceum]CRG94787.1 GTP-binding protein, putative [Plasmodium gallinaceum]